MESMIQQLQVNYHFPVTHKLGQILSKQKIKDVTIISGNIVLPAG